MNMEQKLREILGLNIKVERVKRGLTQEKLGELAEISTKHITKIESGDVSPSIYLIYKIAKALNVSIDKLIQEVE